MGLVDDLALCLKERGWEEVRSRKHGVWRFPATNQMMTIPTGNKKDSGRRRQNYMKTIEEKERTPYIAPYVKDTTMPPEAPQEVLAEPTPTKPKPIKLTVPETPIQINPGQSWFVGMKLVREHTRMTRQDLALEMTKRSGNPWSANMVRKLEMGKLTIPELKQLIEHDLWAWASAVRSPETVLERLRELINSQEKTIVETQVETPGGALAEAQITQVAPHPEAPHTAPNQEQEPPMRSQTISEIVAGNYTGANTPVRQTLDRANIAADIAKLCTNKRLTDQEVVDLHQFIIQKVIDILLAD